MAKETSISVSKKTYALVKSYQKEFNCRSLEQAVLDAIQWARAFIYVDSVKRRELTERVAFLESEFEKLKKSLEKP